MAITSGLFVAVETDCCQRQCLFCRAMTEAGVNVRLSIYASRGHGGLERLAEAEGLSKWQDSHSLKDE